VSYILPINIKADVSVIKDCPQLICRHLFADPIIFCLDEGFTCHAFCYRKPTTVR
jgi:hypothetical protein